MFDNLVGNDFKGDTVTTATSPKTFRHQREHDPDSEGAQSIRDAYWTMLGHYATPGVDVDDFDTALAKLQAATGWSKGFAKTAILGHAVLQDLPLVRALQAETRLLDIPHLAAIASGVEELGPDVDAAVLLELDHVLLATFTPKRDGQQMPQRNTVTDRIRALIKRIDPARAYDRRKRKKRENETGDTLTFDEFCINGRAHSRIELMTNATSSARISANVAACAREQGISLADAAIKLLAGDLAGPQTTPVVHVYTPRQRDEGEPVYIPGSGWTDPAATDAFDAWIASREPLTHDLDAAAQRTRVGYVPSEEMRRAVAARDGTCIFPGCNRAAERCQLDHRIPYQDGGATSVDNLYALCQQHHNVKTDRRAFYIPDPHTGDIVWCFSDGAWELSSSRGLIWEQITPTSPRWRSSLRNVRNNRSRTAEFFAKCHTVLDQFDVDLDLAKASAAIEALEGEYELRFPFRPELPYQEPDPVEPDFEEPPFPDPEYYVPESHELAGHVFPPFECEGGGE